MRFKSKRSKACDISQEVKHIVYARDDSRCIFCGSYSGLPNAHFIPRSHGGLGIEENIITACPDCHYRMDNTIDRPVYLEAAEEYLKNLYPGWNKKKLVYNKWELK